MISQRIPSSFLVVGLIVALVATGSGRAPARPAPAAPSLRLIAALQETSVQRWDSNAPVYTDLGTYLAPVGGPLELHVRRRGGGRFDVRQMVPTDSGATQVRRLPSSTVASLSEGLRDFFEVTVATTDGTVLQRVLLPFCPQVSYSSARVDDSGPDRQRYRSGCWASEVTEGVVWGVDEGWAVDVPGSFWYEWREQPEEPEPPALPDGTYDVRLAITPTYQRLFGVSPAEASRSVRVTVTTMQWDYPEDPGEDPGEEPVEEPVEEPIRPQGLQASGGPRSPHPAARKPIPEVREDAHGLPDLAALRAWGMSANHDEQSGRDYLVFAATVWNAGPGPLVVEGFRTPGSNLMNAFQYFYEHGERTGRAEVGTLEFDERDGHSHWHFTDFAQYRLLNAASRQVVRSEKEAFCLAHTDAVDLTVRGASWQPGSIGLHTACGWRTSLWSRQVLDAGWGDTYMQWTPGQSFDITDVPNGTYIVEVKTNPDGRLRETRTDNNVALRRVILDGRPGERTVRFG